MEYQLRQGPDRMYCNVPVYDAEELAEMEADRVEAEEEASRLEAERTDAEAKLLEDAETEKIEADRLQAIKDEFELAKLKKAGKK